MNVPQVIVTPLARIPVAGGDVLHAIKRSDEEFKGFGEAYFSWVACDAVKAWKRHTRMTLNLVVPVGRVRFVFTDGAGAFTVEEAGEDRYVRLTVAPNVWFGFQGLRAPQSLVLNVADLPHDPMEVERLPLAAINYQWPKT